MSGSVVDVNVPEYYYITTADGAYSGEKYVQITTGDNGTGTMVYDQGAYGYLTNQPIDIGPYVGQTLYFNAIDGWGDGWDGTTFTDCNELKCSNECM